MLRFQFHLAIIVMACVFSSYCQDPIFTFSPSDLVCIGETVTLTCYVYPPTGDSFTPFALLSFNSSSSPRTVSFINNPSNGLTAIGYSATIDSSVIPVMGDSARIQLTISSYQVSDSNTIFGGFGALVSNGTEFFVTQSQGPSIAGAASSVTLSVVSNITQDSLIYCRVNHDVSSVQRSDTLTYNLTLHFNGTTETLPSVPKSQVNSTPFTNKFLLDTYYRISVSAENCNGGSGIVDSKTFVLLRLRDNWELTKLELNRHRVVYTNLLEPAGGFEEDYLSKDYFLFRVVNNDTNEIIQNLTTMDFYLFLPQKYEFDLLPSSNILNANNYLEIYFNGELVGRIPLVVEEVRSTTVMILLIVLFVLLLILLFIIIVIIVSFVIIHFKRKRDSEK